MEKGDRKKFIPINFPNARNCMTLKMNGLKGEIKLSPAAEKAIEILNENGFEAYAVGGAVRDCLLGKAASDFDVATSATPSETVAAFSGCKTFLTGEKHGTVTVLLGESIEITTFRSDGLYEDKRRPKNVKFVKSIAEDLSRRDFTVNALAYSPKTGIIDLYGGLSDLKEKILRAVGDPETRFDEDALRILRALRFSATLGFEIEENTGAAIKKLKSNLGAVSAERIFSELKKLLSGSYADDVLIKYADVIFEIIPELAPCYKFEQHSKWHAFDVYEHIVRAVKAAPKDETLKLTMLFHDVAKPKKFFIGNDGEGHFYGHAEASASVAAQALKRLKAPNKLINDVFLLVKEHDRQINCDDKAIKKVLSKFGTKFFFDLMAVKAADNAAQGTAFAAESGRRVSALKAHAEEIIERGDCYDLGSLAINGDDLKEIGYCGKAIGKALGDILNDVIVGNLQNDRVALLKSARKRLK